jgi:hypothetical protein
VQAEFTKKNDQIVKEEMDFGEPDSPPTFHAVPHADDAEALWEISDFSVTEEIEDIVSVLSNDQIDYMNPPTTASASNYQWNFTGCCSLEPVFKMTDPTATDCQNKNAFVSGIAFGVAGAAAIAVVQELPKEIKLARCKRRSKSTDSEESTPSPTLKDLDTPSNLSKDTKA